MHMHLLFSPTDSLIIYRLATMFDRNLKKAQLMFEYAVQAQTGPRPWHGDLYVSSLVSRLLDSFKRSEHLFIESLSLRRSFRGYRQPQPFSVDLVGSVCVLPKPTSDLWTGPFRSLSSDALTDTLLSY